MSGLWAWLLPPVASDHGAGLDRVTIWVHVLAAVLFLAWGAVFVYSLWRFRAKRRTKKRRTKTSDEDASRSQAPSSRWPGRWPGRWPTVAEVAIVAAEAAILLGLSIPLFSARLGEDVDAAGEDAVEVRVVAQQYAWNVHYPGPDGVFGATAPERVDEETNPVGLDRDDPLAADDVVLVNQLHLPVGRVAVLRLSSKDVIHAFSVVEMRVKRDAIPGSVTTVTFRPTVTSEEMGRRLAVDVPQSDDPQSYVYEIACAQLCGLGHARMRGFLTVHTQSSYDAWMAEQQEKLAEPVDDFWR